jgi:SlyX protein
MTNDSSPDARLDALEMRIAYQDETIETLNHTITAQWKQIDALTREVERLAQRVQAAENSIATPPANEPPPPHY